MDYHVEINYEADGEQFVERLKEVSGCKNQDDLADIMGVTPAYISKLKNKGVLPSQQILIDFAIKYNCSIDYLLGLTNDNESLNLTEIFKELLLYCSLNNMRKNVAQDYIEFHDKGDNCSITVQKDYYDLSATIHAYNSSRKLFDKMDNDQIIKYITETIYQNKID